MDIVFSSAAGSNEPSRRGWAALEVPSAAMCAGAPSVASAIHVAAIWGHSSKTPLSTTTRTTQFGGEVFDTTGNHVRLGTRIEAYVGTTLCGRSSTRLTDDYNGYSLDVSGPDAVPGCATNAAITFKVDGVRARQQARNDFGSHDRLDLKAS